MLFEGKKVYLWAGYPRITIKGKTIPVHKFVWERENGSRPPGHDIHHRDGDKLNWSLTNLELLPSKKHATEHNRERSGWKKENGEWVAKRCSMCKKFQPLSLFYIEKGKHGSRCKPCSALNRSKWRDLNYPKKKVSKALG